MKNAKKKSRAELERYRAEVGEVVEKLHNVARLATHVANGLVKRISKVPIKAAWQIDRCTPEEHLVSLREAVDDLMDCEEYVHDEMTANASKAPRRSR